ncbi:hypothetical protein LV779_15650 [Streptomyces thinghirensis]|nr:hypothetical protein [Streptomyces thinghirensis]
MAAALEATRTTDLMTDRSTNSPGPAPAACGSADAGAGPADLPALLLDEPTTFLDISHGSRSSTC